MTDVQIITMDLGKRRDEQYIGDAVYASHDDIQIWLRTAGDQAIALDRATYQALTEYAKRLWTGGMVTFGPLP
jgi:hypothetical protein